MLHCLLCGTPYLETDAYCPGEQCGTDLHGQRMGDPACAVQAWCEPRRITAAPGETVMVTLTLRNTGSVSDVYDPELPRDAARRIGLDRPGPPELHPGEVRTWTIVYTVPPDVEDQLAPNGMFGLGEVGADGGGSAFEEDSRVVEENDVPVRVVSARDMRVAACAPFSVRVVAGAGAGAWGAAGAAAGASVDREHRNGNRRTKVVAAVFATVAAIVVAVVLGMAMADSDDTSPAARTNPTTAVPESTSPMPAAGPTIEAPVTSTPDASDSAVPSTSAPTRLTVPNVVGMTEAQGVALLREKGFRGTVRGSGGTIVSTDPAAGTKVDRDRAEVVVVMSGARTTPPPTTAAPISSPTATAPATTTVPPLVGASSSEAESRLRGADLVAHIVRVPTADSPEDTVFDCAPGEGAKVRRGSTVTVKVATAPSTGSPAPR
ncbi:PASTA domain-containing protein [Embleya sp. NPDC020630]|uniref:PASTA domain-containing protein n=1 Tax=Embleya sp. NPDC020630 TaxID=3363979 RepID=UPI0037974708